jgi:hypothetical protein
MATKIYDSEIIYSLNGKEVYLTPLKIKYLRQFMQQFETVKDSKGDMEAIYALSQCALITMKQYCPSIATIEDFEDNFDIATMYKIIDVAAGIKVDSQNEDDTVKEQATTSGETWESFDLAKLEAEVFLIGIWKDYEDLETSLSLPELVATLESKRELDYQEKKFLAAIQGVDIDGGGSQEPAVDPWEAMKARVFSGGATDQPNDILALQGINAAQAGFGIGAGLGYEKW